jgi:UDP-2-acetamido-3-amino-2,3-dideoxy-glucuronate N-acetyltransferase
MECHAMNKLGLVDLPKVIDSRGNLTVGEFDRHIPFLHRECHQFLICVRGRMTVVGDDGIQRQEFALDRPDVGFYMPPMTWGTQHNYSPDAVLLVFASHYYDAADYIRDYDEFVTLAGASK